MSFYGGRYQEARQQFEDGLTAARLLGDRWTEAGLLNNLGVVAHRLGDLDADRAYHERNLTLIQEIRDRRVHSKLLRVCP
ncbi:MAG: tetratricopeptide repeat protein [Chloroflexi bacterium]|nr:tetratricopeptide repeat protein [Chloroflexota bacterium]